MKAKCSAKYSALLIFALLALLSPVLVLAQQTQPPTWSGPGHWHMWSDGWGLWWLFPLSMFLLFMLFIGVVIFVLGHRSGRWHHHWGPWQMMDRSYGPDRQSLDPTYSALQILNERFAKGEIEKQEYQEKKAAILSS